MFTFRTLLFLEATYMYVTIGIYCLKLEMMTVINLAHWADMCVVHLSCVLLLS